MCWLTLKDLSFVSRWRGCRCFNADRAGLLRVGETRLQLCVQVFKSLCLLNKLTLNTELLEEYC